MNIKILRTTLIISLLLNILFIFLIMQNKMAIAPESTETTKVENTDIKNEEIYENGKTYPLMRVVDGDTIVVGFENKTEYVRLIGINAPELNDPAGAQCYAQESTKHLQEIAQTGLVVLFFDDSQGVRDTYGRLLAYVQLTDGTDLGEYMLKDGYVHEYTYQSTYSRQDVYKKAEEEARSEKRGLWKEDVCVN